MTVLLDLTQERKKHIDKHNLNITGQIMRKHIYIHIDNCHVCAEVKGHTRSPAPMLNYPIPEKKNMRQSSS